MAELNMIGMHGVRTLRELYSLRIILTYSTTVTRGGVSDPPGVCVQLTKSLLAFLYLLALPKPDPLIF